MPRSFTAGLGNWIIGSVQDRNKKRELALEAYKQHLEKQQAVLEEMYALIGRLTTASMDLLDITRPEFNPGRFNDQQSAAVIEQKTRVRNEFNEAAARSGGVRRTLWAL